MVRRFSRLCWAGILTVAVGAAAHAQTPAASTPTPQPPEAVSDSVGPVISPTLPPYEDGQTRHDRAMRDSSTRYYPQKAQRAGISGMAVLDCLVDTQGWLRDCRVVSEQPAGFGFGEAALRMAPLFHKKAGMAGARTLIPLTFKLPQ